jgi:hypothetical protein
MNWERRLLLEQAHACFRSSHNRPTGHGLMRDMKGSKTRNADALGHWVRHEWHFDCPKLNGLDCCCMHVRVPQL